MTNLKMIFEHQSISLQEQNLSFTNGSRLNTQSTSTSSSSSTSPSSSSEFSPSSFSQPYNQTYKQKNTSNDRTRNNEGKPASSKGKMTVDEESEADSGIADFMESPAVKEKKSLLVETQICDETKDAKKEKASKFEKELSQEPSFQLSPARYFCNIYDPFKQPFTPTSTTSSTTHTSTTKKFLQSSEVLQGRDGRFEKKYNSSASLHHNLKTNKLRKSTEKERGSRVAPFSDSKLVTRQQGRVCNVSEPSAHSSVFNTSFSARRKLFSCPEEAELDQSVSSVSFISTFDRSISCNNKKGMRTNAWKNLFKNPQKTKPSQSATIRSEQVCYALNNSYDQSSSRSKFAIFAKEPSFTRSTSTRSTSGVFDSISRIFKRSKKNENRDFSTNTLPLKQFNKRVSTGTLQTHGRKFTTERSNSESALNALKPHLAYNQEILVTEPFYKDKNSLNSSKVAYLSSKYSGSTSMRQALIDFNRWNSLLYSFTSLHPPKKHFSMQDFNAKKSAFKRSAKSLVINIKNTLINCSSECFKESVRLSCCLAYADVVSCCCLVLDFISPMHHRKRLSDSVAAVGRSFHSSVSTSPAYIAVYNCHEVFDENKTNKLSDNVQKVIENSKKLALMIDSLVPSVAMVI